MNGFLSEPAGVAVRLCPLDYSFDELIQMGLTAEDSDVEPVYQLLDKAMDIALEAITVSTPEIPPAPDAAFYTPAEAEAGLKGMPDEIALARWQAWQGLGLRARLVYPGAAGRQQEAEAGAAAIEGWFAEYKSVLAKVRWDELAAAYDRLERIIFARRGADAGTSGRA